ncbi:Thioredoxin domain-containing protein 12, partial [Oopsacas minuta]
MLHCLILLIIIQVSYIHTSSYEDTFNSILNWESYSPSFEIPRPLPKPVMILFYGKKCFASSRFQKEPIASPELIGLSQEFTMVKIEMGHDPVIW